MVKYFLSKLLLTAGFILIAFSLTAQTQSQLSEAADYSFEIYKQIHQYPELGLQEFKTAELVRTELKKAGFTNFHKVEGLPTCVIAELDTKKDGPVIAFRAELDARPGEEKSGVPYTSKIDTVMHSCGHDAHTAILLGTARLLNSMKESLRGKIYFIFQPAEEIKGGADDIVNSGILEKLDIQNIYALHSASGLEVGRVTISPGYTMAGSNYFTIEIEGKGSHAATPYEGSNIPLITAKVVNELAGIPALQMDITERPAVISVTYIETGRPVGLNVLPSKSVMKGTIRAYEQIDQPFNGQPSIEEIINRQLQPICSTPGITCKIDIRKGSPPTYNSPELFEKVLPGLTKVFSGSIDTTPNRGMFSEDFSYFTENIPCLYFSLGVAKDNLGYANVHSEEFSVHPGAFIYGIELFSDIAGLQR